MADSDTVVAGAAKLAIDETSAAAGPKLQLDEATGDYVSKAELKKRLAKRAKKAAKDSARSQGERAGISSTATAAVTNTDSEAIDQKKAKPENGSSDPNAMFKQGFLAEVYKEQPKRPVFTRFPPEPNGFLHLGHAKAIAINFGFASYYGGLCYLRFDDTNPEKEKKEYFDAIIDIVRWLGFTPFKITYSSDNFGKLYELAEKLVTLGKAYVCHCDNTAIKLQRGGDKGATPRFRCEHAEQSVDENMTKFRAMRDGAYAEREAFLRMKQDITSGNPQMWDLTAYRVKTREPHHRTGWDWKIYPTYDFTHCICDSIEGITHSLCTTEFITARESYEWLNRELSIYEPMQREYGRLNIAGTVLSKRGIQKLVDEGIVRGWDDPRLYTLIGIRRRGVPSQALLDFVGDLGVTTATTTIEVKRFEQYVRKYLENTTPRLALILDPIPLVIEGAERTELDVPFSPKDPGMGSHTVLFTPTVFIDRSDFREVDNKDYYRLAPGKTVGLLNVIHPIKVTSFTKDPVTDKVTEIRAVYDRETNKPKTYIQWVGTEGSFDVEVRVYDRLFNSDRPENVEGGFLADVNANSETVYSGAMIESGFANIRQPAIGANGESPQEKGGRFQGLRVGYFMLDKDTTDERVVLNRIVSLREDAGKS